MRILLVWASFAAFALGQTSGKTSTADVPSSMTKIVVRLIGPGIKAGSFAALPRTIYVADPHYARIEDPPDARQGIQKLVIISEPDAYSINLIDHKGIHAVDQGGIGDLHLPIVLPFDPKHQLGILDKLEFGTELSFFTANHAAKKAGPIVNAKPTDEYRLTVPNGSAWLIVSAEAQKPIKLSWKDSSSSHTYEYIVDEETAFNPELFKKPAGIQYREVPPDDTPSPG